MMFNKFLKHFCIFCIFSPCSNHFFCVMNSSKTSIPFHAQHPKKKTTKRQSQNSILFPIPHSTAFSYKYFAAIISTTAKPTDLKIVISSSFSRPVFSPLMICPSSAWRLLVLSEFEGHLFLDHIQLRNPTNASSSSSIKPTNIISSISS